MKGSTLRRLSALLLTLCMLLTALPMAAASSGVSAQDRQTLMAAANAAGFDYQYSGETVMTAATTGGKATASIPTPAGIIAGRGVYAAVLPLNGSNRTVRFCSTTGSGPYRVEYAQSGCSSFAVMLVQPVLDGGVASVQTSLTGREPPYTLTYTATLNMSADMARIAATAKDNEHMEQMVFTCRMADPYLATLSTGDIRLTISTNGVFQNSGSLQKTADGFQLALGLAEGWNAGTTEQVAARLQQTMTITGSVTMNDLTQLAAVTGSYLFTHGWIELSFAGGAIPSLGRQTQIVVPANLAQVPVAGPGRLTVGVQYDNGTPIANADVTITWVNSLGETLTRTARSDTNGSVTFVQLIYGAYQVKVEYIEDGTPYRAAAALGVADRNAELTVTLKKAVGSGVVNTEVTGTTPVAAENLESAATITPRENQTILIQLKVDETTVEENNEAQQVLTQSGATQTAAEGATVLVDFVDATLLQQVDGGETTPITVADDIITIHIPLSQQLVALLAEYELSVQNIQVYRNHGGTVTALTRVSPSATPRDGTYYIATYTDDGVEQHYAVIHAQHFSVYGFGVYIPTPGGALPGNTYPVSVDESAHGSAASNVSAANPGNLVTVTVTPGEGYRVSQVVATDESERTLTVTDNGDGTYSFVMPASPVTVTVIWGRELADVETTGVDRLLNTTEHTPFMVGSDDGAFHPGSNITRAEVVMIFYRLLREQNVAQTVTFLDVPATAWYAQAAHTLASLGIVNGIGDGLFSPQRPITRAEFAAIATRFANATGVTVTFRDVPTTHWAYSAISTAASYGWIEGMGAGYFQPGSYITRAAAATMLNRMLCRVPDRDAIDAGGARTFPDVPATHWAYYQIAEASTAHGYERVNGTEVWDRS